MATKYANLIKSYFVVFLLTSLPTFFLFRPAFSAYFFQDDWFSFSISKATNLFEFMAFFSPNPNLIYYRPLGMQVPFFIVRTLFGLDPTPFRIGTLIIHLLSGLLLCKLFEYFTNDKKLSLLGVFLYLTSSVHLTIFYWAATFSFILAPLFYFGSFFMYLRKQYAKCLVVFIVGFFVNELLITLPIILTLFELLRGGFKHLGRIVMFLIVAFFYTVFRLRFATVTQDVNYTFLHTPVQLLTNLRDYFLWFLNWPEEIHNQFVSFARLNQIFVNQFRLDVVVFSIETVIFVAFFFIPGFLWFKKQLTQKSFIVGLFGLIWFEVALVPVVFFSQHSFSYYLPIPLFGLLLFLLTVLGDLMRSVKYSVGLQFMIFATVSIIWYVASFRNVRFNTFVHWAPRRAQLSGDITKKIKVAYPALPHRAVVLLTNTSENKLSFADQHGLQVIYDDETLQTFYGSRQEFFETFKISENEGFDVLNRLFEIP